MSDHRTAVFIAEFGPQGTKELYLPPALVEHCEALLVSMKRLIAADNRQSLADIVTELRVARDIVARIEGDSNGRQS